MRLPGLAGAGDGVSLTGWAMVQFPVRGPIRPVSRSQEGHDVIDILRGQRLEARGPPCGSAKSGMPRSGTPGDHIPAQRLVADQGQEVRIVDRPHRLPSVEPPYRPPSPGAA